MGSRRSTLRASLILALRTTEEVARPCQWTNEQEHLADLGKLERPPALTGPSPTCSMSTRGGSVPRDSDKQMA